MKPHAGFAEIPGTPEPTCGGRYMLTSIAPARTLACLGVLAMCLLGLLTDAHAGPRLSGRILKVVPEKRLVVLQRSNGTAFRAILRADAHLERLGVETKLGMFRVGDYAVVEVVGALNDDPLEGVGLYDIHTAGTAPPPTGSVNTSIQGGHAIPGGSAAVSPFAHDNPVPGLIGGGQNSAKPNYVPYHNPTQPWEGVPTTAGEPMPAPVFRSPVMQTTSSAHGASGGATSTHSSGGSATGGHATPVAPTFPAAPQGGTMTAAPAPAGSPWLAQAVTTPPGPPSPVVSSAPVTTTRQMPPQMSMPAQTPPNPISLYDESPGGYGRTGMEVVSLQGNVTQIAAPQRMITLQTMTGGQTALVQVRVPPQVGIVSSRTQTTVGLESLRVGDYLMVNGLQMTPGAVEARRMFVNQ